MLDYNNVILSSNAFQIFNLDVKNGRCSHAYLFVSPDENFGRRFCELSSELLINNLNNENASNNNFRIEKRVHPDVVFYGEDRAIDSDTVSKIIESSLISPFEADKKIFVILNVQDMSEINQNKILKTIEEAPKDTYFLLFATSVSRLLPTIMSRVKVINLDELKPNEIMTMLTSVGVPEKQADIVSYCSSGNGTFAEKLSTDSGFMGFFADVVSCFHEINGSRDVLKFSNMFGAKNIDKNEFFDICLLVLRDLNMVIAKTENLVALKNILPKLKVISSSLTVDAVNELIKLCLSSKENLHFNVNSTALVDGFLFKLAEVKVKCRRL